MRWATSRDCPIDRAACAWLIRRVVGPAAEFLFVGDPAEVPPGATVFDTACAELFHHGGRCSFETMLSHFGVDNPVVWDISRIVPEADLEDEVYDAPEGRGLDVVLRGLSLVMDDDSLVDVAGHIFDGLYGYRRRALLTGRDPA